MSNLVTKSFTYEGKRYYVRAKTEDDAKIKAALKLQSLKDGTKTISKSMTVSAWADEWVDTYKKPMVNDKHYKDIKNIIKRFITPAIGPLQLKTIRPVHLQKIMNGTTEHSDSYVSKIYDVIRQIFQEAYRNGLVLSDPAESLKKPSGKGKATRRPITPKERELTLKVAEYHRGGLFVLLMLYCGLRPGEVAALIWKDVDLDKNVIHVRQALKSDGTISTPKTSAGVRDVPIPTVFAERLRKEKKDPFSLVCTNSQGGRYTSSSMQALFEYFQNEMNRAAGCRTFKGKLLPPFATEPGLSLYCYRHTYCTDLQAAGVPINVAKELMGHSSIAVTAQIYTHKSDAAFNNAAALINAYNTPRVAPAVAPAPLVVEKCANRR